MDMRSELIPFTAAAALAALAPGAPSQCVVDKLAPGDAHSPQRFGSAVSASGPRALIGARGDALAGLSAGAAYVFARTPAGWVAEAKLIGVGVAAGDGFGGSVHLSGDRALVAAVGDDDVSLNAGAAYVFRRTPGGWIEEGKLTASDGAAADFFGGGCVDGDTALVGAWGHDGFGQASGAVYVFEFDGASWSETQKLEASDAAELDRFGTSLGLAGDVALIGARSDDTPGGVDAGSVYVFEKIGSLWQQTEKLHAADAQPQDGFGGGVALDGTRALITTSPPLGGIGAAYVFERTPSGWIQTAKLVAADAAPQTGFGSARGLSGDTAVVGAVLDDEAGDDAGAAYVFERTPGGWVQTAKLTAGPAATAYDRFGSAAAVAGGDLLVGQDAGDDHGFDSGGVYAYSTAGVGCSALFGEPAVLPLATGGVQHLALDAGPAHASRPYLVLGSLSGTVPGVPVGAATLPLNPDAYLMLTLGAPNALPLLDGLGVLDPVGRAAARFVLPLGLSPGLAGTAIHHAFLVFEVPGSGAVGFASTAEPVTIVP